MTPTTASMNEARELLAPLGHREGRVGFLDLGTCICTERKASKDPHQTDCPQAVLPNIAAALDAARAEALSVPEVWPQVERDGMAMSFTMASRTHGFYESLFAAAAWLLRHRTATQAMK